MSGGFTRYVSNLLSSDRLNSTLVINPLLNVSEAVSIVCGMKASWYISSNDVNHSFALPALGVKVDAIPGRLNLKTVIPSRLGLYSGMCSELCGVNHGFMPISVKVLTMFDWLDDNAIRECTSEKDISTLQFHIEDLALLEDLSIFLRNLINNIEIDRRLLWESASILGLLYEEDIQEHLVDYHLNRQEEIDKYKMFLIKLDFLKVYNMVREYYGDFFVEESNTFFYKKNKWSDYT